MLLQDFAQTLSTIKNSNKYKAFAFFLFIFVFGVTSLALQRPNRPIQNAAAADLAASSTPKGVAWHMGAWYNITTSPNYLNAYNWDGLKKDLDDMKSGNITWVRLQMDKVTQSTCAPDRHYAKIANELSSRSMKGLVTFAIPSATTTTATDAEVSAFTLWVNTMVSCPYHAYYHDWEISNEPNLHYYWNINENTTDNTAYALSVSYYVKYLKAAYQTIKAIDPSANVLLGGLSQWKDERFMDELTKQGAGAYFDSMSFHPYATTPDGSISELNTLKAHMAVDPLMVGKPIWITEFGVSTTSGDNFYVPSELAKADYLTNTFQALAANGITKPILWYDWNDDICTNCGSGYGLIKTDRTTAPYATIYYDAYNHMRDLWDTTISPTPSPTPFTGTNILQNGSFENTGSTWLSPWSFGVKTGAAGTINQDSSNQTAGSYSARVDVTQSSTTVWNVQLKQVTSLVAGQPYNLTFSAKASTARPVNFVLQQAYSPYSEYKNQNFNVTTSWQTYTTTYTPTVTDANVLLSFNLAQATGSVWLDNISLSTTTGPTATPTISQTNTPIPPTNTPIPTNTPTRTPTPTPRDTIPPTVSITNPSNGATIPRGTTLVIKANASDNVGVSRVEFSVNNSIPAGCSDTSSPYTCNWKVPNKPNTPYTITAQAYDAAGNTSLSTVVVTSIR